MTRSSATTHGITFWYWHRLQRGKVVVVNIKLEEGGPNLLSKSTSVSGSTFTLAVELDSGGRTANSDDSTSIGGGVGGVTITRRGT